MTTEIAGDAAPLTYRGLEGRVCVTGATGFLGGAIARALASRGAEVHALRRTSSSRDALDGVEVTWSEGDVTDQATLERFLRGARWIVHAAGRLGEANVPDAAYVRANVEGTRNVMAAALAASPRSRVLHLSSAGVLGPMSTGAVEEAPYHPSTAYERSKAAAEEIARSFARRGLHVVLARPGFVYGPGDRHVLKLFRAIQRGRFFLIDGGRSRCQPIFVDDAVTGLLASLTAGRASEAYHLVGPRAVTFEELAAAIARALGVPAPELSLPHAPVMLAAGALELVGRATGIRPPLTRAGVAFFSRDRIVSSRKAHAELGFAPACDVTDGVARTVAWYRERGWL